MAEKIEVKMKNECLVNLYEAHSPDKIVVLILLKKIKLITDAVKCMVMMIFPYLSYISLGQAFKSLLNKSEIVQS